MRRTCLFVSSNFPPPLIGGSLVFYHYLLSQCGKRDVLVLTQRKRGADAFDQAAPYGVLRSRVIRDGTEPRLGRLVWFLLFIPWLMFEIVRWQAPVVHVGTWNMVVPTWVTCRLLRRKLVISIHGEELTTDSDAEREIPFMLMWRVYDRLAGGALRGADLIHANSSFTEQVLLARGVTRDRIRVIRPGIDLEKVQWPARIDPEIEASLADKRILLTVGRLVARKGQDMVLRALPGLIETYPDLHYVMAGGTDGPDRWGHHAYENLINELGVRDHATLLTNLDNASVAWLYERCDIFLMPNRTMADGNTEGYGIVFLEAGAHGKPVIGGRAGGAVEAVNDGLTGILVDGTHVTEIRRAVSLLLDDRELAGRLGAAGRRKASENDWRSKSLTYRALITDLAARGPTTGHPSSG
jgi:phosphatidylinositol alpha-1,6-mannosyltransferase